MENIAIFAVFHNKNIRVLTKTYLENRPSKQNIYSNHASYNKTKSKSKLM